MANNIFLKTIKGLMILVAITFMSMPLMMCNNGGGGSDDGDNGNVEPADLDVSPNTAGYYVVGCGTDIFQQYAVESNVKGRVLNVTRLNQDGFLVLNPLVEERYFEKISGKSISEYATRLSSSVGVTGSYMYFSGSIQASFTDETYKKAEYSYVTIMETNWKHSLKIQNDRWYASYLKDYMTDEAVAAINNQDVMNWSGQDIIDSYGTHVMVGIYAGARLDYHLAIEVESQTHDSSIEAYASARFDGKFASAGISFSIDTDTYSAMEEYESKENIRSKGGDSQYANPSDDDDYTLWHQSISTNPVFCGIIKYALIPIWEFADTQERQDELELAYMEYAEGKDSDFTPVLPTFSKITDLKLINTGSGGSVTLDPGWNLIQNISGNSANGFINANLWRGSVRSDHIWLAYKEELTDQPGLEEIHLHSSDDTLNAELYGSQSHDEIYGTDVEGCIANAAVNMNSNTCADGYNNEYYSTCCAYYFWNPRCDAENDLGLYLHYVKQAPESHPIRCVVLGNAISVDENQTFDNRKQNIFWGPWDADKDGDVDDDDAAYVLDKVQWVRKASDDALVNLNTNTQSYHVWDWYRCSWLVCSDSGWDDGWIHAYEAVEDAQYIGYCVE